MKATGTMRISAPTAKSLSLRPDSLRWKYHASIIGRASFIISAGWKRVTPMCSQRRAPFTTSPASATASSSTSPITYAGSAKRISVCGGTCATIHIATSATARLTSWFTTRAGFS